MWPVVEYVLNYEYIVTVLCENKDKPEMHCNGKCHLTKELAKEAGGESKNPFNGKTSKTEIPQFIISEKLNSYTFSAEVYNSSKISVEYRPNLNSALFVSKIIHPPQLG
jgi:hypothetical protein